MGKIAVTGGSGFKDFEKQEVVFLQRHCEDVPPHKVDHKANLLSLKNKDVDTVIGICSVGSLKLDISPGSIVIPNDYINLKNIQTYHDLKAVHTTPSLNEELRQKIITAAKKISITVVESGIYIQTIGPRLETKAEINMIKNYANIVGMTMANEATLAKELGIKYAAICSVDNYANGITKKRLTIEEIKKAQDKNKEKIIRLLEAVL